VNVWNALVVYNANFGRVSSQTNTPRVGQIEVRLEL